MSDPNALWHAEHVNFAALLNLLEAELERFHKGESPDYQVMLDIMFYMTHYPDVLHHAKEDLAFAKIKERETGVRAIVDELAAQHAQLKATGEALANALDQIVDGSITSREHVEAPGRAYLSAFRRHMVLEETAILPVAARLLTSEDWAEINTAIAHIDDPLVGGNAEERFAALRRQIA